MKSVLIVFAVLAALALLQGADLISITGQALASCRGC